MMEFHFEVPNGFVLEGLSEVRPEGFWQAYLRRRAKLPKVGTFQGAVGRTPQQAVNKAQAEIERLESSLIYISPVRAPAMLTVDDLDL